MWGEGALGAGDGITSSVSIRTVKSRRGRSLRIRAEVRVVAIRRDPSSSLLLVLGCTTVKAAKDIAEDILDGVVQPEFRPPPREPAASDGLDQGPGVNQELGSSLRLTLSEPHEQGGEFPLWLGLRGSAGGEGSP